LAEIRIFGDERVIMSTPAVNLTTEMTVAAAGLPVHLARPAGPGPFPCVIILHERYGLVRHTIDLADRLAASGYVVAAPDLYHAAPDQEALHRGDVRVRASDDEVAGQLHAVRRLLESVPGADPERLGIIGACQTGRHSFVLGAQHPIRACVVFYGATSGWEASDRHPVPLEKLIAQTDAPVFGVFGELDHTISVPDVLRLRDVLERNDKAYQIYVCGDAPHGFLNATMPGRYLPDATEYIWQELLAYLAANMGDVPAERRVTWRFECSKHADYDFSKNTRRE
jgi:carboxymethylenebutenolidase